MGGGGRRCGTDVGKWVVITLIENGNHVFSRDRVRLKTWHLKADDIV